ncbi:unnamed protein product, partial [Didymodactylos carnosus]
ASIHTHRGFEQSRRDDLESVVYSLIYFLRGSLPWQGLKAKTKRQKYEKIAELKQSIDVDELCYGFSQQVVTLTAYVRSLSYDERPDYDYCKRLMRCIAVQNGQQYDYKFDWFAKGEQVKSDKFKKLAI